MTPRWNAARRTLSILLLLIGVFSWAHIAYAEQPATDKIEANRHGGIATVHLGHLGESTGPVLLQGARGTV